MSANPDPKPLSSTLSKPLAKPGFRNHSQTRYLLHIQEEITLLLQESTYWRWTRWGQIPATTFSNYKNRGLDLKLEDWNSGKVCKGHYRSGGSGRASDGSAFEVRGGGCGGGLGEYWRGVDDNETGGGYGWRSWSIGVNGDCKSDVCLDVDIRVIFLFLYFGKAEMNKFD